MVVGRARQVRVVGDERHAQLLPRARNKGRTVACEVLIATPAIRLVARTLLPSTSIESTWARFSVDNLFILTIMLERTRFVNLFLQAVIITNVLALCPLWL